MSTSMYLEPNLSLFLQLGPLSLKNPAYCPPTILFFTSLYPHESLSILIVIFQLIHAIVGSAVHRILCF